jgi:tRNA threonylcarbamoyladenosine biosynthesis protein TsaE
MNFTYKLKEIKQAARKTSECSNGKKVWAIHGEMGAGKTTFIHALCENFGVTSAIGSPTYSIINEYDSNAGPIYHMDWYRLKDEEEALQAGGEDCILSGNLCLIEWPEKAISLLPDDCFHVTIVVLDEETRKVSFVTR